MTYLFIYGTLMKGEEREGLLCNFDSVPATVSGRLWKVPAGYPALELTPEGQPICGELIALDNPSILVALDLIEGVSEDLYNRVETEVFTETGSLHAWVYIMTTSQLRRSNCVPLKGNDWRKLHRRH